MSEEISEKVHKAWMNGKRSKGIESRMSEEISEKVHKAWMNGKRGAMTVPVPKDDEQINENMSLEDVCLTRRRELREIEVSLRDAMTHPFYHPGPSGPEEYPGQKDEMRAQTMLAIRAVEEARMRIGKVLQYMDDGVSTYDKPASGHPERS